MRSLPGRRQEWKRQHQGQAQDDPAPPERRPAAGSFSSYATRGWYSSGGGRREHKGQRREEEVSRIRMEKHPARLALSHGLIAEGAPLHSAECRSRRRSSEVWWISQTKTVDTSSRLTTLCASLPTQRMNICSLNPYPRRALLWLKSYTSCHVCGAMCEEKFGLMALTWVNLLHQSGPLSSHRI